MAENTITTVFFNGFVGFIGGFAIGYAVKKGAKIIWKVGLFLIGIYFASLLYLNNIGIVTLNFNRLEEEVTKQLNNVDIVQATEDGITINSSGLNEHLNNFLGMLGVPLASGMAIGFFLGFQRG